MQSYKLSSYEEIRSEIKEIIVFDISMNLAKFFWSKTVNTNIRLIDWLILTAW